MEKHTLLLIDDEPHILTSLKKILETEDREILVAPTAEDGSKILKEREVEVIICDNRLPGVSGLDFFTRARRLYPDAVRILITGYPDLNSAMEAINKAQIWRYLLKPIEVEELKVLVNQAFEYHTVLRENRLLLQIARQQLEWLKVLKEKYPKLVSKEIEEGKPYFMDEKKVSEILKEFVKKYYPDE